MSGATVDETLAESALRLARVFADGGRLIVTAPGRQDHARHVAVEFTHPAITGTRALPAVAVSIDDLRHAVEPDDAVMVVEPFGEITHVEVPSAALLLRVGRERRGATLVRWYHVLWELVQLGLEHPGLTGGSSSQGGDSTNFLYPFLDASETDEASLLRAMTESADAKHAESAALIAATLNANGEQLGAVAADLSRRTDDGGRVFTIGNGGSACDAARLVRLLHQTGIRATCLAEDPATLTALANDLGVARIFSRQIEAAMKPKDVLVAFSTSGASANLLAAFDTAVARDALVVACAGYSGGPMSEHDHVDHRLRVDSSSVHRIQEAQGAVIDSVCALVGSSIVSSVPSSMEAAG